MSELGVNVIQLDLSDDAGVREAVLLHKSTFIKPCIYNFKFGLAANYFLVDIIIHTASSMAPQLASSLIRALGESHRVSGNDAYFIHVSFSNPLGLI